MPTGVCSHLLVADGCLLVFFLDDPGAPVHENAEDSEAGDAETAADQAPAEVLCQGAA